MDAGSRIAPARAADVMLIVEALGAANRRSLADDAAGRTACDACHLTGAAEKAESIQTMLNR